PEAPLSSNFTSLVLRAVEAESEAPAPSGPHWLKSRWSHWWSRLVPRVALGVLACCLGVAIFFQRQNEARNQRFAGNVREFVQVATLPGPEVFEEFDAIQKLQPPSFASTDDDLLAALR